MLASTKLDFLVESDVSAELPSKAARDGTASRARHWLRAVPPTETPACFPEMAQASD